jgi:hypothetical protein
MFSVETKSKTSSKEFEYDRPMTSKEKEEYCRERASQARKSGKVPVRKIIPIRIFLKVGCECN